MALEPKSFENYRESNYLVILKGKNASTADELMLYGNVFII